MYSEKIKTVAIFLLIAVVIALGAFCIFGKGGVKNSETGIAFFNCVQDLQGELSYYLGNTYSDTFGVYSNVEILSGVVTDENGQSVTIKDNEDHDLVTLIQTADKIENNEKTYYALSIENIKTAFNADLSRYGSNMKWYVSEDGFIRVNFDAEPEWWQPSFQGIKIGNR